MKEQGELTSIWSRSKKALTKTVDALDKISAEFGMKSIASSHIDFKQEIKKLRDDGHKEKALDGEITPGRGLTTR